MIIFITGPSGSGKTTLTFQLRTEYTNVLVIDTDDIDDTNALKLLDGKPIKSQKDVDKFLSTKEQMNAITLGDLINNNRDIIILGMTIIPKKMDHRFCIKIDYPTLYKQVYTRSFTSIGSQLDNINKMLQQDISVYKKDLLLVYQYKLRKCVPEMPYNDISKLTQYYSKMKKRNFKVGTVDFIKDKISKLLKV